MRLCAAVELMPKTLAAATVDRLLHHAHILITDGTDSYRLAQATAGKGVRPPRLTGSRAGHHRSASHYALGSATTAAHPTRWGEPMATSGEKR